ncbi:MAG: type VI secretion system protein [Bradyrhizobium sp.]|jgi:type VI secretion system protein
MSLTLRILTYRNQPLPMPTTAMFSGDGGTIGRSPDNVLVLDDPKKYISRTHARVALRGTQYVLTDAGSNPSIINDRPLGNGREIVLGDGDRILIGDYLIEALLASAVSEEATVMGLPASAPSVSQQLVPPLVPLPLFEPPPVVPVKAPLIPAIPGWPEEPLAPVMQTALPDPLAAASILDMRSGTALPAFGDDDPLGLNLFGTSPSAAKINALRAAESDHVSPENQVFGASPAYVPVQPVLPVTPAAPSPSMIPDDYDPLAEFVPRKLAVPFAAPVATLVATPVAIAPPVAMPALPIEPEPFVPLVPLVPLVQEAPLRQQLPEVPARSSPVQEIPPPRVEPTPAQPAAPVALSGSDDAVLKALLKGLGLPDLATTRSGPEIAELVGAMLREATAGTIDILMARAMTKRESRIEMTMMSSRSNNPLKFFPNAESALTQMLTNAMAGYLPPVAAVSNAFDDLKAHELAVIAGMHAALAAVLKRFDPTAIEARLDVPGMMDKLMASSRKAKMWDRLVQLYAEISSDADEDFQRLFGEKFSSAYEEQIDRLHQLARQASSGNAESR